MSACWRVFLRCWRRIALFIWLFGFNLLVCALFSPSAVRSAAFFSFVERRVKKLLVRRPFFLSISGTPARFLAAWYLARSCAQLRVRSTSPRLGSFTIPPILPRTLPLIRIKNGVMAIGATCTVNPMIIWIGESPAFTMIA